MKKRIIHLSKSTVSVILTLCMLVSCVTVGLIATDAAQLTGSQTVGAQAEGESVGATDLTVYYSKELLSGQSLRLNVKYSSSKWHQTVMTDTNQTIDGNEVYQGTVSLDYDGFRVLQFQVYNGDDWVSQVVPVNVGDSGWISGDDLNTYNGKYYDGANWVDPIWDTGNHSITIDPDLSHGTITANKASAAEGTTVTVAPTGNAGYKYDWGSLTVTTSNNVSVPVSVDINNNLTFVMPDDVVTVSATFSAIGKTTVYVFKSTSVQKIYLWDTVGDTKTAIGTAWPGNSFELNTSPTGDYDYKEYNFGGAAYYKYTFDYAADSPNVFGCVINKSGDDKKTADIENLEKGHTYYIGWSGAGTTETPIYCTKNNYPYYYLNYKVKDTDDSTLQKVSFEFGYYDLSVQRGIYQFCITREWNATQDQRFGTGSFTRTSGQQYTKHDMESDVSSYSELDADVNGSYRMYLDAINTSEVSTTIFFPTIDNYNVIGAYENNGNFFDDVTAWTLDTSKNVLTGSVTKTLTVASPEAGTYYYKAVIKAETPSAILGGASPSYYYTYYPSPYTSDRNGCKEIEIAADCTSLTFTFNSSTGAITAKAKYPTDWPPSDIETTYTNDSAMNIVYANNDDYANNEGNVASYKTGVKQNSGGTAYWYDLTDLVLSDYSTWSNFYFCLSNATDKSGIQGDLSNSVTDGKDATNTTAVDNGSINLPNTGTTLFVAQNKVKNTSARFVGLNSFNRKKLVHLGVVITDTSGTLDYKFYYQEETKVSTGPKLVKIYAKNGELRDSTYNRFTLLADTDISDTYTLPAGYAEPSGKEIAITHEKVFGNSNYDYAVNVPVGSTITISTQLTMLMYGKEASNRKQEIDRQHYTIPNQRPKDKHCGKI